MKPLLVVAALLHAFAAAAAPQLDLTPTSPHEFNSRRISEGATGTFTVTMGNNAAAADDLVFADPTAFDTVSDSDCSHFQFVFPATPLVIAPGANRTFTAAFDPSTAGSHRCDIYLYSNDPASPHSFVVTGTGTQSVINMTPDSRGWGDVVVNSTVNQTVSIANSPGATVLLAVTILALSGPNADEFAIVSPETPFTVVPDTSQTVILSCTPASAGIKTATITATHDADIVTNADSVLTCTGVNPEVPVGYWTPIVLFIVLLAIGSWATAHRYAQNHHVRPT